MHVAGGEVYYIISVPLSFPNSSLFLSCPLLPSIFFFFHSVGDDAREVSINHDTMQEWGSIAIYEQQKLNQPEHSD